MAKKKTGFPSRVFNRRIEHSIGSFFRVMHDTYERHGWPWTEPKRTAKAWTAPDFKIRIGSAYKDGAIDSKTKRLMAMAIALGAGCRNCVLGQAMGALDLGATREEFLETISVVVSMRGTTGVAESLRVIQLLDELGKL